MRVDSSMRGIKVEASSLFMDKHYEVVIVNKSGYILAVKLKIMCFSAPMG
jgi:hypothetical protein